jgi:hypothetical protein
MWCGGGKKKVRDGDKVEQRPTRVSMAGWLRLTNAAADDAALGREKMSNIQDWFNCEISLRGHFSIYF